MPEVGEGKPSKIPKIATVAAAGVAGVAALVGAREIFQNASQEPDLGSVKQEAERLKAQNVKYGDLLPNSIYKDPATGKEKGVILHHGSLGDIPISGTVGVSTENQELIVRAGPQTNADIISQDELSKLGVDLGNLDFVEVYGSPYDKDTHQEGEPFVWVKTTASGKDIFAARKFAQYDGKTQLQMQTDNGLVIVPFEPTAR